MYIFIYTYIFQVHDGTRKILTTPTLLALARSHFACATLSGVELEDDGGGGTAGSHWEQRALMTEYMSGRPSGYMNVKSERERERKIQGERENRIER